MRKDVGDIVRINTSTGAQSTFLDIPTAQFSSGGERGVLGLAFHSDYATNGRFFVFLTKPSGDIEVREYERSANPAAANPNLEEVQRPSEFRPGGLGGAQRRGHCRLRRGPLGHFARHPFGITYVCPAGVPGGLDKTEAPQISQAFSWKTIDVPTSS